MRRDFCAYFDHRYFERGMAMYESLVQHCPQARLFVLCLSERCHAALTLLALPNLVPIRLEDFEAENLALAAAKANRSLIEYYFTLTPWLLDWLLRTRPEIETISYLDGDLYFFSDPEPIFADFARYSTLIIPHRFPPQMRKQEVYGLYNVGWLSFRRDADGLECLAWWRDRCLEWCHDRLEGDRFADQKYLDSFPTMFGRVLTLNHPGANLAAWNMASHQLEERNGRMLVDCQPLIFFHFHNFKKLFLNVWHVEHSDNFIPRYPFLARLLYRPYVRAMARARALGRQAGLGDVDPLLVRSTPGRGWLRSTARILLYRDFVLHWP